jgi:hypothetical protein
MFDLAQWFAREIDAAPDFELPTHIRERPKTTCRPS